MPAQHLQGSFREIDILANGAEVEPFLMVAKQLPNSDLHLF
jgi:hypothetical protein